MGSGTSGCPAVHQLWHISMDQDPVGIWASWKVSEFLESARLCMRSWSTLPATCVLLSLLNIVPHRLENLVFTLGEIPVWETEANLGDRIHSLASLCVNKSRNLVYLSGSYRLCEILCRPPTVHVNPEECGKCSPNEMYLACFHTWFSVPVKTVSVCKQMVNKAQRAIERGECKSCF